MKCEKVCPVCNKYNDCPNQEYREPSGYCDEFIKCEHERICDNCKLDGNRDCCDCFNGLDHKKFICKICEENKPLTIAELEGMDGLPVYVVDDSSKTNCTGWHLVNIDAKYLISKYMGYISYDAKNRKVYKEKPSPRMVKFEQAVKDELIVKLAEQTEFRPAIKAIEKEICSRPHRSWDLFNLPVWEVKE